VTALARVLPASGSARALAGAQLVSTIGNGAYYVTAALYFTRIVGLSPTQLGVGLTVGGAVGVFAGAPLGHVADLRGPVGIAALLTAGAGVSCAAYLFVHAYALFILVSCMFAICQRGAVAARQALLSALVSRQERTRTRAFLQSTYNAGLSVGAAIGGIALLLDTGAAYRTAFAIDAASFVLAAFVLARLPAVHPPGGVPAAAPSGFVVFRDRPYGLISLINMVMIFYVPLIDVALPLWVVRDTSAPRWMVAALFIVTTVSVVIFQIPIARGVSDIDSACRYVRRAGPLLLLACLAFAAASYGSSALLSSMLLLAASALQVGGQMMQYSGMWEISFGLAPTDKVGQYQGVFGVGATMADMLGPLVLTALVVGWRVPGWLVLGLVFVSCGLVMTPAVRWGERTREHTGDAVEAAT
jgi:MFS family permease